MLLVFLSSHVKGSTQDSEILLSYSCLRAKVAQHAEALLSAYLKWTEGQQRREIPAKFILLPLWQILPSMHSAFTSMILGNSSLVRARM